MIIHQRQREAAAAGRLFVLRFSVGCQLHGRVRLQFRARISPNNRLGCFAGFFLKLKATIALKAIIEGATIRRHYKGGLVMGVHFANNLSDLPAASRQMRRSIFADPQRSRAVSQAQNQSVFTPKEKSPSAPPARIHISFQQHRFILFCCGWSPNSIDLAWLSQCSPASKQTSLSERANGYTIAILHPRDPLVKQPVASCSNSGR